MRGAVRVCLDFFAPLFASRQKGEKDRTRVNDQKSKDVISRCLIKCGMTAVRGRKMVKAFIIEVSEMPLASA